MEQVIIGGTTVNLDDTVTEYMNLFGGGWISDEYKVYGIASPDGVIKNLRFKLSAAPGAGKKYTFTLMVNGAPTALTFDIENLETTGEDTTHEIAINGGDTLSIRVVPTGTPAEPENHWTLIFEGDTPNESLAGNYSFFLTPLEAGKTVWGSLNGTSSWHSETEGFYRQVIPTAGTIKNLYVKLNIDPGTAPDAYKITLRKGTPPGAIGSTALTCTITANDTTGNDLINSFAVAAGDVVTIMFEPLNTPSEFPFAIWAVTFDADVDGESVLLGGTWQDLPDVNTLYRTITGSDGEWWDADETWQLGQVCVLRNLYILLDGPPGAGKKWDFTIRKNSADSELVLTIADAATSGNSGALKTFVTTDQYLGLECDPDNTPDTTVRAYWGLVCYTAPLSSGSAELLAWLEVGQDSAELLSQVVIRHVGTPVELSGKFEAQATAELLCKSIVQRSDSAVLLGRFGAQATAELLANAEVINIGSVELLAETAIRHIGTPVELSVKIVIRQVGIPVELPGKITIRHTVPVELLSRGIIRHVGIPVELLGRVEVGQDSTELLARFEVGQDSVDFLGKAIVRHLTSQDLKFSLYVRPLHLTAAEMLIGGRDRRMNLGGLDRKMVVGGRDRRMRIR